MIDNTQLNKLRQRAEALIAARDKKTFPESDVYQLVEELNLYQTELEIQNEDLIKTQIELQLSNNKYTDLYNFAPVAYFTLNSSGLIVDVNQAGLDLLGIEKRILINRCFSRYIIPESQTLFSQYRQGILKGNGARTCDLKMMHWSGPVFEVQLESKSIKDVNSNDNQLLICVIDMTEKIQIEKFMHSQQAKISSINRVRSMNEQVYSISHSQNHSLSVINNYIYDCIRRIEAENFNKNEMLLVLKKTLHQTKVLADIILQMKTVSSRTTIRYELADLKSVLHEALMLVKYEASDFFVKINYEAMENIPQVKIDKLHIQQVILSLTRNSIEAMRDAAVSDPKIFIEARVTDENFVEISVIDNGPGFDKNIVQQIFDPSFTTKSYGMGFGLAISRTIIERHNGHLTAQTNPSGGAHFQIILPCIAIAKCS